MSRKCKHWIKDYLLFTESLEAPNTFHFWTAVGTLAGALRGKTWIDMGHWKWKPNFFIIFVAPPGVATKSTAMGLGMDLLREVEGIHFGPQSVTWQALTDALMDSTERFDVPGGTLLSSSLTINASELGTFLDPTNQGMIDLLVDMWDGKEAPWKRRTRQDGEVVVENPWINFMGCTTPAWIAENFPEYAIGGGFTSRTVFIYAETKRRLSAYPQREVKKANAAKLKSNLINDLIEISAIAGEFKLTEDAFEWGTAWYQTHWGSTPDHLKGDRLGGYVARKQTHIHKTAIILSAAESNNKKITAKHLMQADKFISALEADMKKVFSVMGTSDAGKQTSLLMRIMAQVRSVSKATLWRQMVTQMSNHDFENAVEALLASGYCVYKRVDKETYLIATKLLEKPSEHLDKQDETSFD